MLPRLFVPPSSWQPLRPWLAATGALAAAVVLATAAGHRPLAAASLPAATQAIDRPDRAWRPVAMVGASNRSTTAAPSMFGLAAGPGVQTAAWVPALDGEATSVGSSTVTGSSMATDPSTVTGSSAVMGPSTVSGPSSNTATATVTVPSTATGPSTAIGPPTLTAGPAANSEPTLRTVAPGDSLAWVASAWLLALALLMAAAVAYLVRIVPRLPAARAAACTAAACAGLAVTGLALAVWADSGLAGALLSSLLVVLPAVTVLSGHFGYRLGRAPAAAPRAAAGGLGRRSHRPAADGTRADATTSAGVDAATATADARGGMLTPTRPDVDRSLFGNFRIEGELGRGAMGVVYLGRHQRTGQRVALKTLAVAAHREGTDGAEAQRRFLREAAMATRLRHPDIVAVVGSGEQHGLAYIAMEHVDGHDLGRHTRADALLPLPVLVDAMARVADALAYAHTQGVVHRDIKPANLMWNPVTAQVKVTDFGVARVVDGSRTSTGVLMGTPTHFAPEQLAGRTLDGRTDLYALGVTLFQLLTGQLPQRAESMAKLMFEIANVRAPDVRRLRPETPPALAAIVARLLEKRPEDRHADGRALAADLRSALLASAPTPTPASLGIASLLATGHNSGF